MWAEEGPVLAEGTNTLLEPEDSGTVKEACAPRDGAAGPRGHTLVPLGLPGLCLLHRSTVL